MPTMKRVLRGLLVGLSGLLLGLGSAWWSLRDLGSSPAAFRAGPWEVSLLTGSPNADSNTRARVALHGLLALGRSESLYYLARSDSAGNGLRSQCRYRVSGLPPPARWWSVTAYADDHFLFDAPQARFSLNGKLATLDQSGEFAMVTGPTAPGQSALYWLPTPGDRGLELVLRLYQPAATLQRNPLDLVAPRIELMGACP